jgi:hypothetical protein
VIHSRAAERRSYLAFVLLIFGAVLLGFGRTFFLRAWFPEWLDLHAPKEPYFLLHGTVATAWFITLIAQSSLVTAGRIDVHRRLGKLSMGLAAAVFVTGIAAAVIAARRPTGFIGIMDPPQVFLAIPLLGLLQARPLPHGRGGGSRCGFCTRPLPPRMCGAPDADNRARRPLRHRAAPAPHVTSSVTGPP